MKKLIVTLGAAVLVAIPATAATASAGNAYGTEAKECVAGLGLSSVGEAIQVGKDAHPDAKMTAKTIAESVHCSG